MIIAVDTTSLSEELSLQDHKLIHEHYREHHEVRRNFCLTLDCRFLICLRLRGIWVSCCAGGQPSVGFEMGW